MKHFSVFFRLLALLLAVAFAEKLAFAGYHTEVTASLTPWEIGHALLTGLRFDLAISAIFAFLAIFLAHGLARLTPMRFTRGARIFAFLAVTALVLIHGADLLYFAEAGRHMGYELKEAYNSGIELATSAAVTYFRPVLLQLALLFAALWLTHRALPVAPAQRPIFAGQNPWWHHLVPEFKLVVLLAFGAIMARGGFQSVPLEPLHAQALGNPQQATLALNGAYNAMFSSSTPYSVEPVIRDQPGDADYALVHALFAPTASAAPAAGNQRPNVVFVFLESWSAIRMSSYGAARETTPRYDALRAQSFTTRDMLAGGHRTTEGLFATLCSAQNPLGATVAQTQLQNYSYECLPKVLRAQGYHTAFFQGTVSGTSGTGAFAQLLGFEESFGKEHAHGSQLSHNFWGMHDPDIYRFTLDRLATLPQPFLAGINTNSTHDSVLPEGQRPAFEETPETRYDNVLNFADAAFGDFVSELYARYPDTVLVALADHAGPGDNLAINRYRIPFLIYAPGRLPPTRLEITASQRDVAPTLLAVLGLPQVDWFSGRPLTETVTAHGADYYHAGLLGWVEGNQGIEFPIREPAQARCFDATNLARTDCSAETGARRDRALAFTRVMQEALFSGQLKNLAALRAATE